MPGETTNIVKTLSQNDPVFAKRPHLDFQELRRRGLAHIGELSGRIWTDHNAHDPGITILEVLCYALIDLGYRTSLPIQDLLTNAVAGEDPFEKDDNFFTPLEILSCNPTTLSDYRRLLLEIEGVRNAWLEVAEVPNPAISTKRDGEPGADDPVEMTFLNGLYKVLLEVAPNANEKQVLYGVKKQLSAHRNLCEDFHEITILCPEPIGLCGNIEIEKGASAAEVYAAILDVSATYISPEITYYSLQQMLDKGKAIEEVFAGRPFLTESVGFVDMEELESLELREELRISDLYSALLKIDGVVAVRNLVFDSDGVGSSELGTGNIQRLTILKGYSPAFSLEKTCIDLITGQGALQFDKKSVEDRLTSRRKRRLDRTFLDLPVPRGRHLTDLGEYPSILQEFPLVYGIGEGGLPDNAGLERHVQALQLQGYLLFYDQLLIDYLAQLTHLREFFSLTRESERADEARHTHFSQSLSGVSALPALLQTHTERDIISGNTLAVPVRNDEELARRLSELSTDQDLEIENHCTSVPGALCLFTSNSETGCRIYIDQAHRDILQGDYTVEIYSDRGGYFFLIRFSQVSELVLIGTTRYPDVAGVREAVNFTTFMAGMPETFRKASRNEAQQRTRYHYELIYNPALLSTYVQRLLENESAYLTRRDTFLNHLLARFAEQFTDYTLLRFGAREAGLEEQKQTVEDKSRFLSEYDDVNRNRGRAFDYTEPAWGTENVSGFEKRVALLAGMNDWRRRSLCNFEVVASAKCTIALPGKDKGEMESYASFESTEQLQREKARFIAQIKDPRQYHALQQRYKGFDADVMRPIFSTVPTGENIKPIRYRYGLILSDASGNRAAESEKQNYASENTARAGVSKFIKSLVRNDGTGLNLKRLNSGHPMYFLDVNHLTHRVIKRVTYRWHQCDDTGKVAASATSELPDVESALDQFAEKGDHSHLITGNKTGYRWVLSLTGGFQLDSANLFIDEEAARRAWLRSKNHGQDQAKYVVEKSDTGSSRILLQNDHGHVLATAKLPPKGKLEPEAFIERCRKAYGLKRNKVSYAVTERTYGYQLVDRDRSVLLTGIYCFESARAALDSLLEAQEEARVRKNFRTTGNDENPEYRVSLWSKDERFLATSTTFGSEKERDTALRSIVKTLKTYHRLVDVKPEPPAYSWEVKDAGLKVIDSSAGREFSSESEARINLVETLVRRASNANDQVAAHLYLVEILSVPTHFKFIYRIHHPAEDGWIELWSEKEYDSKKAVETAYGKFVESVPTLKVRKSDAKNGKARLTDGKSNTAVFEKPAYSPKVQKAAEELVQYTGEVHALDKDQPAKIDEYRYRLVDKDRPIARSTEARNDKPSAETLADAICAMDPFPFDPKQPLVKVVCPEKSRHPYHFAVCLLDEGAPEPTYREVLVSYTGFESQAEAETIGNNQVHSLLALATNVKNIRKKDAPISLVEEYADDPNLCDTGNAPLAVVPETFVNDCDDRAVNCAFVIALMSRRYPIRRVKDEETDQVSYGFEATRKLDGESLWVSAETYDLPGEAEAAYQRFRVLISHKGCCRCICVEGKYVVVLVEILLESVASYMSKAAAWGDEGMVEPAKVNCDPTGVRLLASVLEDPDVYHLEGCDHCHQFVVATPDFRVARFTEILDDQSSYEDAVQPLLDRGLPEAAVRFAEGEGGSYHLELGGHYLFEPVGSTSGISHRERFLIDCVQCGVTERNYAIDNTDPEKNVYLYDLVEGRKIARVARKKGKFDKTEVVALTRACPIYARPGGYGFRVFNEDCASLLDQPLEICGCDPHEDKDHAVKPYTIESVQAYASVEGALKAYGHFRELAAQRTNYRPVAISELGPYVWEITDSEAILARSPLCYPSKTRVGKAVARAQALAGDDGLHVLEHILLRTDRSSNGGEEYEERTHCTLKPCREDACNLTWQEDPVAGDPCLQEGGITTYKYVAGADPYSFWATLVLPGWLARFRSEERRFLFKQLLYREVPVLVGLNILWLSPQQMCSFEQKFQTWLELLRDPEIVCDKGADIQCELIRILEGLKNDPLCETPAGQTASCDCNGDTLPAEDCCIVPAESIYWLDSKTQSEQRVSQEDVGKEKDRNSEKKPEAGKKATAKPTADRKHNRRKKPAAVEKTEAARDEVPLPLTPEVPPPEKGRKTSRKQATKKQQKTAPQKPDAKQVNALLTERKQAFQERLKQVQMKRIVESRAYGLAAHILDHPVLPEYRRLVTMISAEKWGGAKTKAYQGFVNLLKVTTWRVLDVLIWDNGGEIPEENRAILLEAFGAIKEKGVDLAAFAKGWKSEALAEIMKVSIHEKYLALFSEV